MRVAAFDCGTNSLRLLIADVAADGTLTDLRRETRIVRLGQGVDATGEFARKHSSAPSPWRRNSPRWPPTTSRRS